MTPKQQSYWVSPKQSTRCHWYVNRRGIEIYAGQDKPVRIGREQLREYLRWADAARRLERKRG